MTRPVYGGASGDVGADASSGYFHTSGGTARVWTAQSGGSQITDLQTLDGTAVTVATVPTDGSVVMIKLPDGYTGEAWIGPSAGPRVRLTPPAGGSGSSNSDVAAYVTGSGATKDALIAAFATLLQQAKDPDQIIQGAITRNASGVATSASVVWNDGSPGTYTADKLSTAFPGAVDAYHITYGSPVTKTFSQPAVTRDPSTGAVTNRPALVVS